MATSNNQSLGNLMLNLDDIFDDFQIICLDVDIKEHDNTGNIIRNLSDHLQVFDDIDACVDYVTENRFRRIFLIISDRFALPILTQAEQIDHVVSVFILRTNAININRMSYRKCRGIFNNKHSLMINVADDIFLKTPFISINNVFGGVNQKESSFLDAKDPNVFNLLTSINEAARSDYEVFSSLCEQQQMLRECRLAHANNQRTMKNIDDFSIVYNPIESIKWYTKDSFLYKLINKALRTQAIEIIDKFRFFIKHFEESLDLFFAQQIYDRWSSPSDSINILYRGQLLSSADIIRLRNLLGENIIISQYISTTKDIHVAEMFAGAGEQSPESESVIYVIDTSVIYEEYMDKPDPSIYYYDISCISEIEGEQEVLFRIGTTFKVQSIEKRMDHRWYVKLRLEKVEDYRYRNLIHRRSIEIVQAFFKKASQKQNVHINQILEKRLSSNTINTMSVFIRLGHLVKHHPKEQLHYYQSALELIPSNETTLLEIGYWAIRIRCILSVKDWTTIPLKIYRQTVLHIQDNDELKQKLYRELAHIDEARGDFNSAKKQYRELLKYTNDDIEKRVISDNIRRFDGKPNDLKPVLPSGQVAYWYLYVSVLTIIDRGSIDHQCNILHRSIDNRHFSRDFSFTDLLPNIHLDERLSIINFHSIDHSVKHVFIVSLTDEPLVLVLENNLTVGQLKQKIRYSEKYDLRLIHMGISLTNDQQSLDYYHIDDRSIIYLIHGPRILNRSMNQYEQNLYGTTGLILTELHKTLELEKCRLQRVQMKVQKDQQSFVKFHQKIRYDEPVHSAYEQYLQKNLVESQQDDDEEADPVHLLKMSESDADHYINNSGPQAPPNQLLQSFLFTFTGQATNDTSSAINNPLAHVSDCLPS